MNFPLMFSDISLWLAVTAIILLVTSELLNASPNYSSRIQIDRRMLRISALGVGIAFLVTVAIRALAPS